MNFSGIFISISLYFAKAQRLSCYNSTLSNFFSIHICFTLFSLTLYFPCVLLVSFLYLFFQHICVSAKCVSTGILTYIRNNVIAKILVLPDHLPREAFCYIFQCIYAQFAHSHNSRVVIEPNDIRNAHRRKKYAKAHANMQETKSYRICYRIVANCNTANISS